MNYHIRSDKEMDLEKKQVVTLSDAQIKHRLGNMMEDILKTYILDNREEIVSSIYPDTTKNNQFSVKWLCPKPKGKHPVGYISKRKVKNARRSGKQRRQGIKL